MILCVVFEMGKVQLQIMSKEVVVEMLPSKKAKGILLLLGCLLYIITGRFFAYSIAKMYEAAIISVKHPLETYFAAFFYTAYAIWMFMIMVFLLGSTAYLARTEVKSRSGMILAFGLLVSSLSAVVIGWFLSIGMMITETYTFAFFELIDDTQILNVLPAATCFSLIYLTAWLLFKPLKKKLVAKKRQQLDTEKKKRGYRRYLQAWGLFFSIFTLMLLPISVQYVKSCFDLPQLTKTWYTSAWIHGASVVIAGSELLIGINLLLDRSPKKVSVGALLLGSSSVGFFTTWFCYILIAAKVFNWGFGNYNVYIGRVLFVIIHRIISAILLMLALLLSRRKSRIGNG